MVIEDKIPLELTLLSFDLYSFLLKAILQNERKLHELRNLLCTIEYSRTKICNML